MQIIDRAEIEKSGDRTTEELLRSQPVANANGVPSQGNQGAIADGQAGASIALRGLDPGATLVLINGHRIAPQPSGTFSGFETFFDLNTIPRAAIGSVEILKFDASTIYGADAIAGVVNFKLRRGYRDAEVNVEYGNTTDKDSGEFAASLVFGLGDDKTRISGVLNYYRRNSIFRRDRAYDRDTPATFPSTTASPFNLEVSRSAAEAAAGRPIMEVDLRLDTFFAHAPFFTNGTAPASSYVFTADPSVTFPVYRYFPDLSGTERYGAFLSAEHKIFGDQMVVSADLFFQRAKVRQEVPPTPTFAFQDPSQGGSIPPLAIPPRVPGLTSGGPSYEDVGLPADAYNPFNPFPQIISGFSQGRLFELGAREFDTTVDSVFSTVGLSGDKLFDGHWGYDATFRYSEIESDLVARAVSISRFQRTLNAADPIFDPASPEFIGTTIPYNPFTDYRVPVANNYRLAAFTEIHPRKVDRTSLATVDVNIHTTELFHLPAGSVGFAFGAQFRHETLDQNPGPAFQSGDAWLGVFLPVSGSDQSYAGYVEASVPVVGGDYAVAGFHALDITTAARYEAFSNDSNALVPKFGIRWQPWDDSLTIRSTWAEGFRSPTLAQSFFSQFYGTSMVYDPIK
ncbi:MAG: TonB-dependent receptor domain-containing protein, partial [Bryobacteraceae bacterium]